MIVIIFRWFGGMIGIFLWATVIFALRKVDHLRLGILFLRFRGFREPPVRRVGVRILDEVVVDGVDEQANQKYKSDDE